MKNLVYIVFIGIKYIFSLKYPKDFNTIRIIMNSQVPFSCNFSHKKYLTSQNEKPRSVRKRPLVTKKPSFTKEPYVSKSMYIDDSAI